MRRCYAAIKAGSTECPPGVSPRDFSYAQAVANYADNNLFKDKHYRIVTEEEGENKGKETVIMLDDKGNKPKVRHARKRAPTLRRRRATAQSARRALYALGM